MKKSTIASTALILACATLHTGCASTPSPTSNKWRIEFDGSAKSAGEIGLQLVGVDQSTIADVTTKIAAGTGENHVARRVADELTISLPRNRYSVEVDDGEDVLIKKRRGVEDFEVRLSANSVVGVSIDLERE